MRCTVSSSHQYATEHLRTPSHGQGFTCIGPRRGVLYGTWSTAGPTRGPTRGARAAYTAPWMFDQRVTRVAPRGFSRSVGGAEALFVLKPKREMIRWLVAAAAGIALGASPL